MKNNGLLFGGALLAAALAAQSAEADFDFTYVSTTVEALDYGGVDGPYFDTFTGATAVSLEAGKDDFVRALAFNGLERKASVGIVIPAPAALPLFGAGGLLVSRRRRRE